MTFRRRHHDRPIPAIRSTGFRTYTARVSRSIVRLPLHVKWSGPRVYDLDDPQQERVVYQVVLREGTAADVRAFIDVARLRALLPELDLPDAVRSAWTTYFDAA